MRENVIKSKKQNKISQSFIEEHGRIPPQAIDLEESVLGAIMLEKQALNDIVEFLKPEIFYKESHQFIYAAIQQLYNKLEPIDTLTVVDTLRKSGKLEEVGGPAYVAQLTRKVLSAANIEFHARIILQKFIQRELIGISTDIIKRAYEETTDVFNLLNEAEDNLFAISENHIRQNTNSLPKLLMQARDMIENAGKQEDSLSGVPSGFTELDRITSGWQKQDLVIIAARPAMGKTAFVLSLAKNLAVNLRRPVALFSLEMSAIQIATRLLSSESEVPSEKIRSGKLNADEQKRIAEALNILSDAPIYIDDTPALNMFELKTKCRKLKQKQRVELIVIDYLQLMMHENDKRSSITREQEISSISRSIKALAKELDVPILCLSQLSRNVEKRGGPPKPQLSDLRESGSIEQDADIVIFLYRPEYYKLEPENNIPGSSEIIIAKHRNGRVDSVFLKFIDEITVFKDIETYGDFLSDPVTPNQKFDNSGNTNYTIRSQRSKMNDMDNEPKF